MPCSINFLFTIFVLMEPSVVPSYLCLVSYLYNYKIYYF